MTEQAKEYTIGIKCKQGGYSSVDKTMTLEELDQFYDETVAKGGKIIGIINKIK